MTVLSEFNEWRHQQGLAPVNAPKPRKKYAYSVSLSAEARQHLLELAAEHDCFFNNEPSLSGLLEEIGLGNLAVRKDQ